jgi:hypothetical protein
MTLRALVGKEVDIRLVEDQMTFVCTIRYGRFRSKVTAFPVEPASCVIPEENQPDVVRIRNRFRTTDGHLNKAGLPRRGVSL